MNNSLELYYIALTSVQVYMGASPALSPMAPRRASLTCDSPWIAPPAQSPKLTRQPQSQPSLSKDPEVRGPSARTPMPSATQKPESKSRGSSGNRNLPLPPISSLTPIVEH